MKEICPNCQYTLEFDENNYEPGTSVELECPMCGQEITVFIPVEEKTEKPAKEPKDSSNQEPKVAEPAAPQIVYVETESSSNKKWVIYVNASKYAPYDALMPPVEIVYVETESSSNNKYKWVIYVDNSSNELILED